LARLMFDGRGVTDGTDEQGLVWGRKDVGWRWIYSGQLELKSLKDENAHKKRKMLIAVHLSIY